MRANVTAILAVLVPAATLSAAGDQETPSANDPDGQPTRDDGVDGSVPQGRLGVTVLGLTADARVFFGAPRDCGLLVAQVAPDSPAARAGLLVGDVVTRVGDDALDRPIDLVVALGRLEPHERVPIEVVRHRETLTLVLTIGERGPSV